MNTPTNAGDPNGPDEMTPAQWAAHYPDLAAALTAATPPEDTTAPQPAEAGPVLDVGDLVATIVATLLMAGAATWLMCGVALGRWSMWWLIPATVAGLSALSGLTDLALTVLSALAATPWGRRTTQRARHLVLAACAVLGRALHAAQRRTRRRT